MGKQTPASIGMRYNNTITRNEGIYGLSIAEPRMDRLNDEGVYLETLVELRERITRLEPLERGQIACQQHYEKLTDRLNKLIYQSIGRVSTVYNLANIALGQTDPASLESLPSRSDSHTVKNQTTSLLESAAFVRVHAEAFAAARVPPTLVEELEALAEDMSATDEAQEKARVAAEEASQALFVCRGTIYLTCKTIYSAGRNAYRKEPVVQDLFAFRYMKSKGGIRANADKTSAPPISA